MSVTPLRPAPEVPALGAGRSGFALPTEPGRSVSLVCRCGLWIGGTAFRSFAGGELVLVCPACDRSYSVVVTELGAGCGVTDIARREARRQ